MNNTLETGNRSHCTHELHFASLYALGREIVIPCDATGLVDMGSLPGRMRDTYLGARAMIGRDYAYPTVQVAH